MTQVRVAAISHYKKQLESLGCNPARILLDGGFSANFFDDNRADDLISYQDAERLLQIAATASGCEYFGALLGARQNIEFLGLLALVMTHAQCVGDALDDLSRQFAFHVPEGSLATVSHYGALASLTYTVTIDIPAVRQTNELAMAEGIIVLNALCGKSWQPHSIKFIHKAPKNIKPYLKIFNAPVYFNQDKTEIIFPASDLHKPISNANTNIQNIFRQQLKQQEKNTEQCLQKKIEIIIRYSLPDGNCSIEYVADKIGVHTRKLQRMLRSESTSFTAIIETARSNIALERLRHSDISVTQLAGLLGYIDSSTFNRAFKRWHNTSPGAWKKHYNRDNFS